jgi:hypothetical protein
MRNELATGEAAACTHAALSFTTAPGIVNFIEIALRGLSLEEI